jgi:hypothetical protein
MHSITTLYRTAGAAAPAAVRTLGMLSRCPGAAATTNSYAATAAAAIPSMAQQQRRGYHENIIEHYENPRNVGSLDKNDEDVGTVSLIILSYPILGYEYIVLCCA